MINLSTVLGNIVKSIVDNPDKVVITEHVEGDEVLLTLTVAEEDVGMVIGKHGKIAKAMRTVMKTVAKIDNRKVTVEIK
ncbi:MAG: KH domain-containing protein [Clostridia bacterium]|nr:KH domain-containing protein [Clostridia bacterium]MBQ9744922.1 KH domain-containing protein [Clostridia bacterium]